MSQDPMLYSLQLEMLERDGVLSDEHAIELLRSEFALAQNAGRFDKVAVGDIRLGTVVRDSPQEGVTRYVVEGLVEERTAGLDDERAEAVLCEALTSALNAAYFVRVCEDALRMQLLSRAPATVQLPFAA